MRLSAVNRFLLACFFWTLVAGWSHGQRLPDGELPAMPVNGLSDEDGVLGKNSSAQRRVTDLLQTLRRDHGYRMYVILKRSLISSDPTELSSQLQQEWLPEGGGLVVVFESDTRKMGFGRGLKPGEGMEADSPGVPAYGLVEIISNALLNTPPDDPVEVYVERLVSEIVAGLNGYFVKKEAPVAGGRSLRLALVTIGSLSLLALGGMGVGWMLGKADKKQSETRVFPGMDTPERLGAPYGGGCGATGFFGDPAKK